MQTKGRYHTGGYIQIRVDGETVLEHRYAMEQHIGRKLATNEVVHHINGVKDDNRLENLMIMEMHNTHVHTTNPLK